MMRKNLKRKEKKEAKEKKKKRKEKTFVSLTLAKPKSQIIALNFPFSFSNNIFDLN